MGNSLAASVFYSGNLNIKPMPRPLKVFRAHLGFYDSIVAATSQKAALEAWGAKPTQFSQGFAAVTHEPDAVAAALANPGIVLRRPFGENAPFKADADIPKTPKLTAAQKRRAEFALQKRKKDEAAAKLAEERKRKRDEKAAEEELAEIERAEAQLRDRRQSLQRKFQLRAHR